MKWTTTETHAEGVHGALINFINNARNMSEKWKTERKNWEKELNYESNIVAIKSLVDE